MLAVAMGRTESNKKKDGGHGKNTSDINCECKVQLTYLDTNKIT